MIVLKVYSSDRVTKPGYEDIHFTQFELLL